MNRDSWIALVPSLILAAGILVSTGIAVLTAETGQWALAGPLVMSLVIVGTGVYAARRSAASVGTIRGALLLAAALLVACALVAWRDPAEVASVLPVLSACVAAPLGMQLETRHSSSCSLASGRSG